MAKRREAGDILQASVIPAFTSDRVEPHDHVYVIFDKSLSDPIAH